jgi:uncharacterized membrane protein
MPVLACPFVTDERTREISLSRSFDRGSEEFSRVLAFSDGLFAIAMTLLIVAVAVPNLSDADSISELASDLNDKTSEFVSFFISFAVIGRYWIAHHQFFARLDSMDGGLISINLVYLAFIAFLPFPTDLLGTYFENPLSVAIYAVSVAIVSGLEVVLFRHAHRRGMLREQLPEDVYRWGVLQSASPVLFFLLSVPVAFVSTGLAVAFWFLGIPFAIISDRWKPAGAEDYFG